LRKLPRNRLPLSLNGKKEIAMTESQEKDTKEVEEKTYDLSATNDLIAIFRDGLPDDQIKSLISQHLEKLVNDHGIKGYDILFLFDDQESISTFHSNRIYQVVKDLDGKVIF
jgi:hypothetical protein